MMNKYIIYSIIALGLTAQTPIHALELSAQPPSEAPSTETQATEIQATETQAAEKQAGEKQERLDAAVRYLKAIDYDKQLISTMKLIAPQYIKLSLDNLERQNNQPLTSDLRNSFEFAVQNILDEVAVDFTENTRLKAATIFAENFTATELDRISVIMEDPVMKKFQSTAPGLTAKLSNVGINEMTLFAPLIEKRMTEFITEFLAKQ